MIYGQERYTLRRYRSPVDWSTNEAVVDPPEERTIRARIEPMRPDLVQYIPEGIDVDSARWCMTRTQLQTAGEDSQIPADEIIANGETFVVTQLVDARAIRAPIRVCVAVLAKTEEIE